MSRVYLCGGCFELIGDLPADFWSDELTHFRSPRPYSFLYTIHLELVENLPAPLFSDAFEFRRHDLVFRWGADSASLAFLGEGASVSAGLELALSGVVRRLGGFLIHASAGDYRGETWVMPGPSGAGKSTAALGGFDKVLSDERVALLPMEDGWIVWATPFWSRGRTLPVVTDSSKFGGFFRLTKGNSVEVMVDSVPEMVTWVMRSCVLYDVNEEAQRSLFSSVCALVARVPCFQVRFPKEGSWVPSAMKQVGKITCTQPKTP